MGEPKYLLGNVRDYLAWDDNDWDKFSRFWENLPRDQHMADGGTYRRRKYTTISYHLDDKTIEVLDQDGFLQSKEINKLNGGVTRRFEPIDQALLDTATFRRLVEHFSNHIAETGDAQDSATRVRQINIHQHRIVATRGESGNPTPEGIHRDGVAHIVMMMVERENVSGGVSTIYDNDQTPIMSQTLTRPGDFIYLDDATCMHSASPVEAVAAYAEGHRDMFFLEFC
ncbi:2OG-Fe dioxygenase family protein [Kineosporia sp. NBRC 101731]|uniref:2OG-Fe dioxygenase family protein n=1 Tax=Kineosporia sp. NBRC 101731 TaxID=3032199 RepID=UPI0024A30A30|nr:2OG-Fe dioxygenase family protein [Kineosporia sp. NBRC 101731]GLY28366.1 hypothetical protein Kisp02_17310 [Kineosporia sp. NBRC 101731]